ncbi:MAG: DUF4091 domain-containing protein [Planctomycetes bacterium]|nr:DUF4091 domain-containing protein [Planctomycetota bacterium]
MDRTWFAAAAVVLVFLGAASARADWQVGATPHTVRLMREDPPPASAAVELAAARNEWRGFQVFVRSDAALEGVTVEPADLRGPDGAVIRAADAVLYREHQMEIKAGTSRNDAFRPGWYPDPLIPFRHPLTGKPLGGARLTAVPFSLPAGETHGFWVDLYVPPDARAGVCRGTYRVTAAGGKAADVPVTLAVWNFALPATPTMKTALGSPAERLRGYHGGRAKAGKEQQPADWAAVDEQCARMLADHRINASPPQGALAIQPLPDGSFSMPAEKVAALRDFIDRYHVNAVMVPNVKSVVKDPEGEGAKLRAYLAAWDRVAAEVNRTDVVFYIYLIDEPNDQAAYEFVRRWGKPVRDARSAVKVMVVEQTKTQDPAWGDLYGAVDIWCPLFPLFDRETAAARQAAGETIWTYTALCQRQPTPWWHIDWPLLNYRVPAWISWRYRIRGLLYWGGMSHWSGVEDPWTDPWTYGRPRTPGAKGTVYNGEGTLAYPGRAAGYDGIAASLRLKALRDSIEDYEYLSILERSGRAAEAEKVVLPLAASWFEWGKDPALYDKARAALAELILKPAAGR